MKRRFSTFLVVMLLVSVMHQTFAAEQSAVTQQDAALRAYRLAHAALFNARMPPMPFPPLHWGIAPQHISAPTILTDEAYQALGVECFQAGVKAYALAGGKLDSSWLIHALKRNAKEMVSLVLNETRQEIDFSEQEEYLLSNCRGDPIEFVKKSLMDLICEKGYDQELYNAARTNLVIQQSFLKYHANLRK